MRRPLLPRGAAAPGPLASRGLGGPPCLHPCCLRGTRLSWKSRVKSVGAPLARTRPKSPGVMMTT